MSGLSAQEIDDFRSSVIRSGASPTLATRLLQLIVFSDSINNFAMTVQSESLTVSQYIVNEIPAGTVDGTNTVFTMANVPVSTIMVYIDGTLQQNTKYSLVGVILTFVTAPVVSSWISVTYFKS